MTFPTSTGTENASHAAGQTISSADENRQSADENALEVKLGTGASTPTNVGDVLTVTAPGATAYMAPATPQVTTKTATYSVTSTDTVIEADATVAAFTVTLPTAVSATGKMYVIKKIDGSRSSVTVNTTSSQLVDGVTTIRLASQGDTVSVVSDGANWVGQTTTSIQVQTHSNPIAEPSLYPSPCFAAGTIWRDPTFNTPILRLSDRTTASAPLRPCYSFWYGFNRNNSRIRVENMNGGGVFFTFSPSTMKALTGPFYPNGPVSMSWEDSMWSMAHATDSSSILYVRAYSLPKIYTYDASLPDGSAFTLLGDLSTATAGSFGGPCGASDVLQDMHVSNDGDVFVAKLQTSGGALKGWIAWRRSTNTILANVTSGAVNEVNLTKNGRYVIHHNAITGGATVGTDGIRVWDLTGPGGCPNTTLSNAILIGDTMAGAATITVASTTGFAAGSSTLPLATLCMTNGNAVEWFTYTGKTGTTFTGVTRAYESSVAAAHIVGTVVSQPSVPVADVQTGDATSILPIHPTQHKVGHCDTGQSVIVGESYHNDITYRTGADPQHHNSIWTRADYKFVSHPSMPALGNDSWILLGQYETSGQFTGSSTTAFAREVFMLGLADTAESQGAYVRRFLHHRTRSPLAPSGFNEWYSAIDMSNVSPDGQFVLFASNWDNTLSPTAVLGTSIASGTAMTGSGTVTCSATIPTGPNGFAPNDMSGNTPVYFYVDSECFRYTGISGASFTGVTRAVDSGNGATTAANHTGGTAPVIQFNQDVFVARVPRSL